MKIKFFIFLLLCRYCSFAQISTKSNIIFAKEFSKEIAIYKAKSFVINNLFGESSEIVKFEIDALAASSSGELTSLSYRCTTKNKEGLVLGFFGDYVTSSSQPYTAYAFKDFSKEKAIELLSKIEKAIEENSKYLLKDENNNNFYFQFDDVTFLMYYKVSLKIRVFWNGFDSEWNNYEFKKTKSRFLNKKD